VPSGSTIDHMTPLKSLSDSLPPALRLMRLHQWTKNGLLFLPIALAHEVTDWPRLFQVVLAVLFFSLCASGIYVWNDFLDIEADRAHPTKCRRPLAAGEIDRNRAPWMAVALCLSALILSSAVISPRFAGLLSIYLCANLLYSGSLKKIPVLDVVFLTLMYVLRIYAGGVAGGVAVSDWLLTFSLFFFLSIAFAKRVQELQVSMPESKGIRGYQPVDIPVITQLGLGSGLLAVLVISFYIRDPAVGETYSSERLLWLLCPVLLFWIGRFWLFTHRGNLGDDPVVFVLRDKLSYAVLAAVTLIMQLAYWL